MNDPNLIQDFLIESTENLDQLDRDLVALEKNPGDRERLANIFRTIHTIKGTCGFFGFSRLESVTHKGENLLSRLRDGRLHLTPSIICGLLALVDAVREMLAVIKDFGHDGDKDYGVLIETLTNFQGASNAGSLRPEHAVDAPRPEQENTGESTEQPDRIGAILVQDSSARVEDVERALGQQAAGDPRHLGEILVDEGVIQPQDVLHGLTTQQETRQSGHSEGTIRVDVGLLDKLMNLVGELVLARNQILQFSNQKNAAFVNSAQRLNLITTELQEGVMKTRMQPIGNIWSKLPRVVRDLAVHCGKKVRLEMEGKETELDKTIIEAIKDPLTHLVRNAVDHGIETPEVRLGQGKSAEGCVFLRAFHEGGQVNIEITDDGAGIHLERIKHKALERGLINPDQAARMSERELAQLIFLPGLSTTEKVTNLSGRGVGMDVVKTNIEAIGGTVDVHSRPACGATITIKIPLTLAIIPALIVTSGGDRFAIPQVNLLELVRLEGERARKSIEKIYNTPVYRLRGNLLPLVYLDHELKVEGRVVASGDEPVNIVVLQADNRRFGLVVEGIKDTEEIVVKPLGKQLKDISVFAGATIMGDGKIALILDVLALAQSAGVVPEVRTRALGKAVQPQPSPEKQHTLLLCDLGNNRRLAIPLSLVARLEQIPRSAVEMAADQEVVQYRGRILPLIRLSRYLDGVDDLTPETDVMQVIVYTEQDRSAGLVVHRIVDILETAVEIQNPFRGPGIQGSAVIGQRVTDLLDVPRILEMAQPAWFDRTVAVGGKA